PATIGSATNQLLIDTPPTPPNGNSVFPDIIVGGTDFAKYDPINGFVANGTPVGTLATALPSDNIKLTAATPTLAADVTVNALITGFAGTINLGGHTLTIGSGGLLNTSGGVVTFSNGTVNFQTPNTAYVTAAASSTTTFANTSTITGNF